MSNDVQKWVWDHSQASGNDLIVLLKIADNANSDGGGAYPGVKYLAAKARISKRAVYDCLARLKQSGELAEEEHGGGRGRKTVYRVVMGTRSNGATAAPFTDDANGADFAPFEVVETVQPAALNGAAGRNAPHTPPKEEPSRTVRVKNPPTPQPSPDAPPPPALVLVEPMARPVPPTGQVFAAWQEATGKHRAKLDDKRRRLIDRALKAYPLDDVLAAVQGWRNDPWPERPRHIGLDVLLRDAEHIEKFADLWRNGPPAASYGQNKVQRQLDAIQQTYDDMTRMGDLNDLDELGPGVEGDRGQAQRQLPRPAHQRRYGA